MNRLVLVLCVAVVAFYAAVASFIAWPTIVYQRQQRRDGRGLFFETSRAKTGKPTIGTVSRRTERLIAKYCEALKFELLADAPLFRDVHGAPYTMFSLARDFRVVREAISPGDKRRLMDMRRSGAVEAGAGDVDPIALANKMANSIDKSGELQDTYLPRQVAVVRLATTRAGVAEGASERTNDAQKLE